MSLDDRVRELAEKYRPLAVEFLKEAIRIPADYVDRSTDDGGDPLCGLSNHEGPRLEYLKRMLVEHQCVARAEDTFFDAYGNLTWVVQDPDDGISPAEKKVVYMDGHTDTVAALREQWREKIGPGCDAYLGLTDPEKIDREFLKTQLGFLPPEEDWDYVVFGRGSADQLGGVVAQMIATKIMLELKSEGALKGVIVRSIGTAAEEDNDGGGPMYFVGDGLKDAPPELVPDVVILTEGTSDSNKGAVGIYRGQRGRMQIEVEVTGKSCHGSMPWEGLNPLEFGAYILTEAREQYDRRETFGDHEFLSHGTRTASWAKLDTPSDCAVPDKFTFRFDRRLTYGELPQDAVESVESLPAVTKAREAGLKVEVRIPRYQQTTWKGYQADNAQIYMGWITPEEHQVIQSAVDSYSRVVTPLVPERTPEELDGPYKGSLRQDCRVDRWIFSTDGVGFLVPKARDQRGYDVPDSKGWLEVDDYIHPPMFGIGPGVEQNTHKIGEAMDSREMMCVSSLLARFPSLFYERSQK